MGMLGELMADDNQDPCRVGSLVFAAMRKENTCDAGVLSPAWNFPNQGDRLFVRLFATLEMPRNLPQMEIQQDIS